MFGNYTLEKMNVGISVSDCEKENHKSVIAITKLDTNHIIQMQLFNESNTIDYNLINQNKKVDIAKPAMFYCCKVVVTDFVKH